MSQIITEVTAVESDSRKLPAWASPYALAVRALDAAGLLHQAAERIRFSRQGGYHPFDVALFLLCLYLTKAGGAARTGQRRFSALCSGWRPALAALAGRQSWATQASVSRCLQGASRCDLVRLGRWLLGEGSALGPLLRQPASQYRDACGRPHLVLDYDPTIIALRKRGLPHGPDLPEPIARATDMAAPGYKGRKRGEVQIAAHMLGHAGTGTWCHVELEAGNPHPADVAERIALSALEMARLADVPADSTVIRVDGGGDVTSVYRLWCKHGLTPLVRMTRYSLLQSDYAADLFASGAWQQVRDSGSGPRREAIDLGDYLLDALADELEGVDVPRRARLVVSRYPAEAKRGAGYHADGWNYELFGTALPQQGWPAAEVVKCYFERASIENRFAQLDAETDALRAYSTDLQGQTFAMLIALWAFNLKVALGARLAAELGEVPAQPAAVDTGVQSLSPGPVSAKEAAAPAPPSDPKSPDVSKQSIREAVAQLPWRRVQRRHPGWTWNGTALHCPAGNEAAYGGVIVQGRGKYARFTVASKFCFACPKRAECTKSQSPGYTRTINVPGADALPLGTRLGKQKRRTDWDKPVIPQRLSPPITGVVGKRQPTSPLLSPDRRPRRPSLCAATRCSKLRWPRSADAPVRGVGWR